MATGVQLYFQTQSSHYCLKADLHLTQVTQLQSQYKQKSHPPESWFLRYLQINFGNWIGEKSEEEVSTILVFASRRQSKQ